VITLASNRAIQEPSASKFISKHSHSTVTACCNLLWNLLACDHSLATRHTSFHLVGSSVHVVHGRLLFHDGEKGQKRCGWRPFPGRFRQTLLLTSLEVNQATICDQVPGVVSSRSIFCTRLHKIRADDPPRGIRPDDRRESGAHAIFLYWRRDPQFSNCLQRPPVQGKKACTRPYSTPLHTAKFPMQYGNDIRISDRGAPLHAPSIGLLCAQNTPGCHPTAPTLLRNRVRGGLSGAGRGNVELTGHPTIKKRNAAPTNGDRSCFPCGLSQGCFLLFRGTVYVSSHALILWLRFLCNHCITCQTESRPEKWNKNT